MALAHYLAMTSGIIVRYTGKIQFYSAYLLKKLPR
jgi:hypothetical protein